MTNYPPVKNDWIFKDKTKPLTEQQKMIADMERAKREYTGTVKKYPTIKNQILDEIIKEWKM